MESSVLIAIITAITSIVVAVIQMSTSLKLARLKEPLPQPNVASQRPTTSIKTTDFYRTWLWIGSILIISNIIWQFWQGTALAIYAQMAGGLWCTCLLAYFRPIHWAYVAGTVTLFNAISLFASFLEVGMWESEDLVFISIFYVINAILASAIAYLRMMNSETL